MKLTALVVSSILILVMCDVILAVSWTYLPPIRPFVGVFIGVVTLLIIIFAAPGKGSPDPRNKPEVDLRRAIQERYQSK